MQKITPDIFLIEGLRAANVYLLVAPEGLTLVDTGMRGEARKITTQLAQAGYAMKDLRQVAITHAHPDHTGSAIEIVRQSGAKILAYKDEVPYLEGTASLPPGSWLQRVFSRLSEMVMPNPPALKVDIALEEGQVVPDTGGFIAVHAPGHTPGSLCLYHPERHILFCGDAILTQHPLTGRKGLREPFVIFSVNPSQVWESIRKLGGLEVQVLLSGHGAPVLEKAGEQIQALIIYRDEQGYTG
jgi:glyoxylase-like metal-dependent hydrolase (beta-lactamase superfamily II)